MARSKKELTKFKMRLIRRRTRAELYFEKELRNRNLGKNFGFKIQKVIGFYIADFFFRRLSLIVELDGDIHNTPNQITHDLKRDEFLKRHGFRVLRFKNEEALNEIDRCIKAIQEYPPVPAKQKGGNCSKAAHEREMALRN